MRAAALLLLSLLLLAAPGTSSRAAPCADVPSSRVVEIDASSGPLFGDITKHEKEPSFLHPKEVVLTFDDGPMPWVTRSILDTLDRFCAKATFFAVGRMAVAYPDTLREITNRGHTLGGHTWSHPLNLRRLKPDKALDEIERGFAAIALANRDGVAPFFRFPGLSDSAPLLAALQRRGIATFTVDVVSDDSYIADHRRLADLTLRRIEARGGGIVLFHDIKPATAKALPVILAALKERGYSIVHIRAKARLDVLADYEPALAPQIAKNRAPANGKARLMPFYGTIGPERVAFVEDAVPPSPVTALSPPPRERLTAKSPAPEAKKPKSGASSTTVRTSVPAAGTAAAGWATRVEPSD